MEKKTINFIVQEKGGVGKSTFTYYLANKALFDKTEGVHFMDLDVRSKSTTQYSKFINPLSVDLYKANKTDIDRAKFADFLLDICEQDRVKSVVADLGAESSAHFLAFMKTEDFKLVFEEISELLEIKLIYIVGGGAMYSSCMKFVSENIPGISKSVHQILLKNKYLDFNIDMNAQVKEFADRFGAEVKEFDKVGPTDETPFISVVELMQAGEPAIEKASGLAGLKFKKAIKELDFAL